MFVNVFANSVCLRLFAVCLQNSIVVVVVCKHIIVCKRLFVFVCERRFSRTCSQTPVREQCSRTHECVREQMFVNMFVRVRMECECERANGAAMIL